ncbi:MAG: hypothetical protein GY841_04435 [FCB group bacterium]|nr:hypothetical protein [FCB group bacterium]
MKPLRFLTCVYGDDFADYLFVLLNSIDEVYGSDAQPIIYYDDLSLDVTKEIKRKSPRAKLYYYNLKQRGLNIQIEDGVKGHQQQIAIERFFMTAGVNDALDGPMVVLDCDMLIRKRFDEHIPDPTNFDIMFTYKTEPGETFHWPVNCGIQYVINSDKVRAFYNRWQKEVDGLVPYFNGGHYRKWGGIQQTVFGRMIDTRNSIDYMNPNGFVRDGCVLRGVPCKYMNEARRTANFEDACVVHYKGPWRKVLRERKFNLDIMRTDGGAMYDLWTGHLERWNER